MAYIHVTDHYSTGETSAEATLKARKRGEQIPNLRHFFNAKINKGIHECVIRPDDGVLTPLSLKIRKSGKVKTRRKRKNFQRPKHNTEENDDGRR